MASSSSKFPVGFWDSLYVPTSPSSPIQDPAIEGHVSRTPSPIHDVPLLSPSSSSPRSHNQEPESMDIPVYESDDEAAQLFLNRKFPFPPKIEFSPSHDSSIIDTRDDAPGPSRQSSPALTHDGTLPDVPPVNLLRYSPRLRLKNIASTVSIMWDIASTPSIWAKLSHQALLANREAALGMIFQIRDIMEDRALSKPDRNSLVCASYLAMQFNEFALMHGTSHPVVNYLPPLESLNNLPMAPAVPLSALNFKLNYSDYMFRPSSA